MGKLEQKANTAINQFHIGFNLFFLNDISSNVIVKHLQVVSPSC